MSGMNVYGVFYLIFNFLTLFIDFRIVNEFENDRLGCNAVSWAPFGSLGSIDSNGSPVMMIITGSCDNLVRLWKYSESSRCWELDDKNLSKCQQHGGMLLVSLAL